MTKETKQEFLNIIEQKEGNGWVNYYKNSVSDVLKIDDKFILFDKPSIKTHFCFGHGQNGLSTQEETDRACDMAHHARTNEKYFLNENLEDINKKIAVIEAYINSPDNMAEYLEKNYKDIFYYTSHRYSCKKPYLMYQNYKIDEQVYYSFMDDYEKNDYLEIEQHKQYFIREIAINEMQEILNILISEKQKFEKRLQTYLKRYGLTKIQSWSYLVD